MSVLAVKVAPGRRVVDPETGEPLGRGVRLVPDTAFWRRRLADGDILPPAPRSRTDRAGSKPASKGEPK